MRAVDLPEPRGPARGRPLVLALHLVVRGRDVAGRPTTRPRSVVALPQAPLSKA
jgi:hypothetical protein